MFKKNPLQFKIIIAFASIYLIWGSTYLAIKFAIETLPPFFMAGTRFFIAGVILYIISTLRGSAKPTFSNWISATIIGGLLLFFGNGGVVWAEQYVPSGLTALLIATVPLWMVSLNWLRSGNKPTNAIILGLMLGLAGITILIGPEKLGTETNINITGAIVLILAALAWAGGSLYSRHANLPPSPLLSTAMEMLAGGVLLFILGFATGEWPKLQIQNVSLLSFLSLGYLAIFGSLIGFTAYIWLLGKVSPAKVSTYAYVNPVVAVFLGWALANEPLNFRTVVATGVIVTAVVLITSYRSQAETQEEKKSNVVEKNSTPIKMVSVK
jgi:drug/metabolite transporter (DMT)-like permease